MAKTCNEEGCLQPVFGGKKCKGHQYLREDKKPKGLTPSRLKRQSEKAKRQIPAKRRELEKQWEFFLKIWDERPHLCNSCGANLGSEPLSLFFDHLLEKSKYPNLKFEPENILLVCWDCHNKKTLGLPTDIHQFYIDEVKKKFAP